MIWMVILKIGLCGDAWCVTEPLAVAASLTECRIQLNKEVKRVVIPSDIPAVLTCKYVTQPAPTEPAEAL